MSTFPLSSGLETFNLFTPAFLWLVFLVVAVAYVVVTWVLLYHWKRHEKNIVMKDVSNAHGSIPVIKKIYFVVTLILIVVMAVSALVYQLTFS